MVRDNLDDLPSYPVPQGYSIRNFRRGEGHIWAEVETSAGCFKSFDDAMHRFKAEFEEPWDEMESRCFFIVHDESGRVVGSAMAWFDETFAPGENYGRVHWVSIVPEFQGKGLAKPLMSAVLHRMAESHSRAVLGTQTFRKAAVWLYLDLGFMPCFRSATCKDAWKGLAEELGHPALEDYLI